MRRVVHLRVAAILVAAFTIGCGNSSVSSAPPRALESLQMEPRVVVGFIGNEGFNARHDYFYKGSLIYPDAAPSSVSPEILREFGIEDRHIIDRDSIDLDDFCAEPNQPYWFKGTNVIGIVRMPDESAGCLISPVSAQLPENEGLAETEINEETLSVAVVLEENPEAIVFYVQGFEGDAGGTATGYLADHPGVDITVSGIPGVLVGVGVAVSLPFPLGAVHDSVVHGGKLHVVRAFQSNSRTSQLSFAGPWWTIAIGGISLGESNGVQPRQNLPVDFAGDSVKLRTVHCPSCRTELQDALATEVEAAAGAISKALLAARRHARHVGGILRTEDGAFLVASESVRISNWEFRRALERSAYVPGVDEFDPTQASVGLHVQPVAGPAYFSSIGWGVLSGHPDYKLAERTAAALGLTSGQAEEQTPGTCGHQTEFMLERRTLWSDAIVALFADHDPADGDPYIYCM